MTSSFANKDDIMSKQLQFILAFCYIVANYLLLVWCYSIHNALFYLPIWIFVCFTSAWWLIPIMMLLMNVRKPILEEEEKLLPHLKEVLDKAQDYRRYRLLIDESKYINAFAIGHNTIAISRPSLELLEPEEIKGILAHELGHLRTRDCVASAATYTSSLAIGFISLIAGKFLSVVGKLTLMAISIHIAAIMGVLYLLWRTGTLPYLWPSMVFLFLAARLASSFKFFNKAIARYTEYRQDAFAQKLGYGQPLKQALLKIIGDEPRDVRVWTTFRYGTHPITHNRIRRLEKLEGLRKDG